MQPLLTRITDELKESVAGDRTIKDCRVLSAKIKAVGIRLKEPDEKRQWFEGLSTVMAGHERFKPRNARKNSKPLRDPRADTINAVLLSLQEGAVSS